MTPIRRTIHPETRIVDAKRGIVDYVASDETLDSYREIIRADGWRFANFKKNSPFVDSHNTSSIGQTLGKVIDFSVQGKQLIERVQWAIDVPENTLAQLGWKMTEAGYLKAVSVGFFPTKVMRPGEPGWMEQMKELGLQADTKIRAIYTEQEQVELSAVVIGANPNALLAAHKAGAINDQDVELFQKRSGSPVFHIPFQTKPQPPTPNVKSNLLSALDRITGNTPQSPDRRMAQRAEPDSVRALRLSTPPLLACAPSLHRYCHDVLASAPEKALWLRAVAKHVCGAPASSFTSEERAIVKALTTGDSGLGPAVSVYEGLSPVIYEGLSTFGAARTFGLVPMDGGKKKLASVTGKSDAIWLTPANQGTAITADASITGASISPEVATLGTLVEVSGEVLGDGATTFEGALLTAIIAGLGYRIDWACLQADGTDDTTDGGMTGIFAHGSVPVVNAAPGGITVQLLTFDDFCNTIGAVAASALQYPCRWWIAPDFLPQLLKINDGHGARLLKPPTNQDDEWRILGFPVTWAAAAPNTNAASTKVAAFGRTDAFTVGLRQDFEIRSSAVGAKWTYNIYLFRGIARARCLMRDATSFAVLKTAGA
jgi:HK97 family phage major capsid protein